MCYSKQSPYVHCECLNRLASFKPIHIHFKSLPTATQPNKAPTNKLNLFWRSKSPTIYNILSLPSPSPGPAFINGKLVPLSRLDAWIFKVAHVLTTDNISDSSRQKQYAHVLGKFLQLATNRIISTVHCCSDPREPQELFIPDTEPLPPLNVNQMFSK